MKDNIMSKINIKKIISFIIILIVIPSLIALGVYLFKDRKYNIISIIIALLSCIPFFISFEKSKVSSRELVIIAILVAFSVLGRVIFTPIPGFKPVTAITIIVGITLGAQSGFMVGSLTAIVSNMFFGQGPWTPFQMFVWGFIGFISGLLFTNKEKPNIILILIVGCFGGVLYSLLMDIWTTLSMENDFNISRYLFYISTSISFMIAYAISNIVFLLILSKPFMQIINRIKIKYGVFNNIK